MICEPINDHSCLLPTSQYAVGQLARADLRELAKRFNTTRALAAWIRSLPQLNDSGPRDDGAPRIACDVAQRARLPSTTPNCFERALLFLVLAEFIDPIPVRQLQTLNTPAGRHTVAVEEGKVINLNPSELVHEDGPQQRGPRNAAPSDEQPPPPRREPPPRPPAADDGHPRVPAGAPSESMRVLMWVLSIADCHADVIDRAHGHERMQRVHGFFSRRGLVPPIAGPAAPPIIAQADFDFSLAAAQLAAKHYGDDGKWAVAVYRDALTRLGLVSPAKPKPWDTPRNADDQADDAPRFGDGMATLHQFTDSDPWDQYRNAVELSHLADPDWRNCGCGMPRNAVELEQLRNFDWKGFGQTALGVTHQVGGSVLRTYGLGSVADATGKLYEQQGWVKPKEQPQPQQQQQQQRPQQPPPAQPAPARPAVVVAAPAPQPRPPVERRSDDDDDSDDAPDSGALVGSLHAL